MAVCASGSPQAKAGVASSVVVDQAYMQSILPQPWSFLYRYLPYMHVLEIGDVGAFCSVDPPTYTLPTSAEFLSFVTGGVLGAGLVVEAFFEKLVKSYLWYSLCECSSGSPTAHPAADSDPGDLPQLNPPGLVLPPAVSACASYEGGPVVPGFTAVVGVIGSDAHVTGSYLRLPAGATRAVIDVASHVVGATQAPVIWRFVTATAADSRTLVAGTTVASGGTFSTSVAVPAGQQDFFLDVTQASGGTATTDTFTATIDFYCGGALPGQPATACCLPDPVATGYLSQILRLVTLIQRQAVPFSFVPGEIHTGISGNGSFAVQGLLGIQIDVTTLPDSYGRSAGEPEELFELGFLTWGTDDGYRASARLDHEHQVLLPPFAGIYTVLGYSLAAGVVVTVTELEREP